MFFLNNYSDISKFALVFLLLVFAKFDQNFRKNDENILFPPSLHCLNSPIAMG